MGRESRKKTTRRFVQNNTSFYVKQHVVLGKTTRRFFELHIVLIFSR